MTPLSGTQRARQCLPDATFQARVKGWPATLTEIWLRSFKGKHTWTNDRCDLTAKLAWYVGCNVAPSATGMAHAEPAASSSEGQVAALTASGMACLTWKQSSVDVCWRPALGTAIVTHLVTRLCATLVLAIWM